MKEKVRHFIYLDTTKYISLDDLKRFFVGILIVPFIMAIMSFAAIKTNGISEKTLFPLISAVVWMVLYCLFVLIIQSKRIKKNFELRFLVNGIVGLFLCSIFWLLYTSFNLLADTPLAGFDFSMWILLFYLLFSTFYIASVILGIHNGIFKKIKEKSQTSKALALSAFFTSIAPCSGVLGISTSKTLKQYATISVQNFVCTFAFVLIIFSSILIHINFVQYFYAKKYKILCDEYGNTTSPKLERQIQERKIRTSKKNNQFRQSLVKKKLSLILKILIGIIAIPIIFFIVVFIVFFIKGFIGIT